MSKLCPVCGKHNFEELNAFEQCPICGWYDDLVKRREPDYAAKIINFIEENENVGSDDVIIYATEIGLIDELEDAPMEDDDW